MPVETLIIAVLVAYRVDAFPVQVLPFQFPIGHALTLKTVVVVELAPNTSRPSCTLRPWCRPSTVLAVASPGIAHVVRNVCSAADVELTSQSTVELVT